jgi:hypothetical protein
MKGESATGVKPIAHWLVAWASLGLIAMGSAQTTPSAPQSGVMVSVEGCVTKDDRPSASSAAAQFVLTDNTAAARVAAAAPSTSSGATAAGAPQLARKMYVLRAETGTIDLAQHVGRQVRVTGATTGPLTTAPLAGRSPEATPNPAPTAPPGSTGTVFDTANLPTLAVTSLMRLDGACR